MCATCPFVATVIMENSKFVNSLAQKSQMILVTVLLEFNNLVRIKLLEYKIVVL